MPISTLTLYSTHAVTIFPTETPSTQESASTQTSFYAGIGVLAFTWYLVILLMLPKRKEEREERHWITVMLLLINSLRNQLRTLSTINSNMISIHSLIVCTHSINFQFHFVCVPDIVMISLPFHHFNFIFIVFVLLVCA